MNPLRLCIPFALLLLTACAETTKNELYGLPEGELVAITGRTQGVARGTYTDNGIFQPNIDIVRRPSVYTADVEVHCLKDYGPTPLATRFRQTMAIITENVTVGIDMITDNAPRWKRSALKSFSGDAPSRYGCIATDATLISKDDRPAAVAPFLRRHLEQSRARRR